MHMIIHSINLIGPCNKGMLSCYSLHRCLHLLSSNEFIPLVYSCSSRLDESFPLFFYTIYQKYSSYTLCFLLVSCPGLLTRSRTSWSFWLGCAPLGLYASPSSEEAYRNRQLTTNFELWVEIFCVPTCFHMRIPKPCLSFCPSVHLSVCPSDSIHLSVPREKKSA